ncbi:MAG: HlyD family type I secretion periplasmic adaptor subunit [Gammaproteobacteria bacterium]|nr:HlyD family type I secretion periplasmic adaptor subunit [Gammaproteobacteria bacterium]MCP5201410.1 HlyD family type I secretion periplasmic adaptor subunit [Gammaproteobacteria bacterium]
MDAALEHHGSADPSFAPDADAARLALRGAAGRWTLIGLLVVVGAFGGVGGWTMLAPLAKAVVVTGVLKVDSNRKRIQHLQGGTIKEVLVKDGDHVRQGQVLLVLDRTEAEATFGIVSSNYRAQLALQARLEAERDRRDEVTFPPELIEVAEHDAGVAELLDSQRRVFATRASGLVNNVEILARQIGQLREKSAGIASQLESKQRQLDLLEEELADSTKLLEKGFIQKPHVLNLERELARVRGEYGNLVAESAETAAAISEKQQQTIQVRNEFDKDVVDELRDVQARVMDLAERNGAAQHVLDNIEVTAPADGVAVNLAVFSARQVVGPGEVLLEIVPQDDDMVIETRVETRDVDNMAVGLRADVRLTALDRRNAPVLDGVVSYVAADATQDERTGLSYFVVRITVPPEEYDKIEVARLQPGMPADVTIKFGERTVFEYLARPVSEVIARAWKEE